MPNSLRCRIKKWCYQGIFNEKDRDRLIHGLDCADVFEQIWKDYNLVMNDEEDSIDVDFLIRFNETLDYIEKSKTSGRRTNND